MRIRTIAAFAAGVVAAAAGTAFATTTVSGIIGADNQIHGCYLTSAGLLRVVPEGTACRDGESPIAWAATGSGAQGPQGAPGPAGPAGPKGDAGARWRGAWVSGTSYTPGDLVRRGDGVWIVRSGVACFIGNPSCANTVPPPTNPIWTRFAQDGAVGPAGARGADGPVGARGPVGAAGPKGDAGPVGPAGGISGYQIVTSAGRAEPPFGITGDSVSCPAGKWAVGGGGRVDNGELWESGPGASGHFWKVSGKVGAIGGRVTTYAVCVNG